MAKNDESKGLQYIYGDDLKTAITDLQKEKDQIKEISLSLIVSNPFRPRIAFDEEKLFKLLDSINEEGQRLPIIVRPKGSDLYEIVDGERRYRAMKAAKKKTIKAIVQNITDEQMLELVLAEIFGRDEISAIEEAIIFNHVLKMMKLTHEELGNKIGKSRSYVSNALRLLSFTPNAQEKIFKHHLKMGQVRPLIGLSDKQIQELIDLIVENGLNSRDIEKIAKEAKLGHKIALATTHHEEMLAKKFNCIAKIRGFKIEFTFDRQEDLMKLILKALEK